MRKVILIVLDSVGAGALPDASNFGDEGANTLSHIAEAVGGLSVPNLEKLGLGHITGINGVKAVPDPDASYGKMNEKSAGKDTITGHWELTGIITPRPFPVYPDGFPEDIIDSFIKLTGCEILWNKPASGTEIIKRFGAEHIKTGKPIVYTSADSVFQIAAHEKVISVKDLYEICEKSKKNPGWRA